MNVQSLMSRNVITAGANETLDRIAGIMWERDVGCVPLIDEQGFLQGVITDRDICMAAYTTGRPLAELYPTGAMASKVISVSPEDSISSAEQKMKTAQIRRLPVVEDGRVIGMITVNDIAREALRERGAKSPEVPPNEVMATLARISEPRAHA